MQIIKFISFFIFIILSSQINAQDSWHILADVKIEKKWDDLFLEERDYPVFGKLLNNAAGKEIELNGYMIPLDELIGQNYFVLSSLPFQTCFFCGGAGPETVAEIRTTETITFTEKKIKIKGRLKLNDSDPVHLYYILEEAKIIN
jgi:hypothetical protein